MNPDQSCDHKGIIAQVGVVIQSFLNPRVARHDLQQLMEQGVTVLSQEVGVNARVLRFPESDGDHFDEEAG
jgi:hypothetical protein